MRKTLQELWRGNIAPQEKSSMRGTDYDESFRMMCKNEEKLMAVLEEKEKETFEKFCDCRDEVALYTEEDVFISGFRLGARIIIESLYEKDEHS